MMCIWGLAGAMDQGTGIATNFRRVCVLLRATESLRLFVCTLRKRHHVACFSSQIAQKKPNSSIDRFYSDGDRAMLCPPKTP